MKIFAGAVVAGLALLVSAAVGQSQRDQPSESAAMIDAPAIEIDTRLGQLDSEGRARVTFVVTARRPLADATVDIVSAGDVELIEPPSFAPVALGRAYHSGFEHNARVRRSIGALRPGVPATFTADVAIRDGGRGFVAVGVRSVSNPDADESLNLYIARVASRLFSSTRSMLEVEAAVLQASGDSAGLRDVREDVERLFESGARSRARATAPRRRALAEGQISVTGRLSFTDRAGATHPIRSATVAVYDQDPAGEALLATVSTDDDGRFQASVSNADGDGTGQDVFIRARAEGPNVRVRQWGVNKVWSIRSEGVTDVADGATVSVDLIAANSQANNLAFEIHQAIEQMARYIAVLNGHALPQLTVRYPGEGDGSSYNGVMLLADTDAHDWDNIQHEYGHHVQNHADIGNNPGGGHASTEDLCIRYSSKPIGIALAYGETWPTVFGLISQREQGLAALGIPHLGDTRYTDVKGDGHESGYDLELGAAADGAEGRELSMMRIMWDLYDSAPDGGEAVAMGATPLWTASIEGGEAPFHAFWNALIQPLSETQRFALGGVMASQRLASAPTAPADGATYSGGAAPTFRWNASSACRTTSGLRYSLIFVENSTGRLRWRSPWQAGLTFTPTAAQLSAIFGGANGTLTWGVLTQDQNTPVTGDYYGPGRPIVDAHNP
jgi:hypothetical protein